MDVSGLGIDSGFDISLASAALRKPSGFTRVVTPIYSSLQ